MGSDDEDSENDDEDSEDDHEDSEDDDDDSRDVNQDLRERLEEDSDDRPYVDAFLLTHPDEDHCRGVQKHLHLAPLSDYNDVPPDDEDKKIVVREIWSSPMVYRRASKMSNPLSEEAKAFNKEARRRVKVFEDGNYDSAGDVSAGDRIRIIGEDENGKTDDLSSILIKVDETFSEVNGQNNDFIEMDVIGPLPPSTDEDEETLSKNNSSVIIRFRIKTKKDEIGCEFLVGGDAEVDIWERLWEKHKKNPEKLNYDLLLAPHHCSWGVFSRDSWSKKGRKGEVSKDAKAALSQTKSGAFVVTSSDPIKDDDNNPPCIGAKEEYLDIVDEDSDRFFCTGEHPDKDETEPLEFTITIEGPQAPGKKSMSVASASTVGSVKRGTLLHGNR